MTQTRKAQLASLARGCVQGQAEQLVTCVWLARKIIMWAAYLIMCVYTMIMWVGMMRSKRGMIMKKRIMLQQAQAGKSKITSAARR